MKRLLDIVLSFTGLVLLSPILVVFIYLVYQQDKKSPFYMAPRMGRDNAIFKMIKLRSMISNADNSGVDSTSADDNRITPIGHKIRKYKLDEITQLWNVLIGDMSLVGPRPNVKNETDSYTFIEKKLLLVRPGITDFSSIVFSDEGDILEGKSDPDLSYNQLIRPWKSRLGLIYIENRSLLLDLQLIFWTVIAIISKPKALNWVVTQLTKMNVDANIIAVSKRESELHPFPPPGSDEIVSKR
ncbi:FIG071646: Sugar transferase [Bathymodiolus thermophilus thioautotrophic gill symbiont]|uniref:Sugar transferase n=1 Tax=Bathymodiolus thermophilus thioautotrophic gill symbiont TaxID=2360 RepID=A0A1J5TX88_9GAMM|nr:sugar transferase [Bathymodiolus thermophilus thioautotrophic gill symbiont]OIR25370.1 sugar transferase [Bathymodiolus thermophilus thioautotrophic gill symbiont]CAB5505265.1 FIG071646: Sugar transferase [Bathymodiolus thermophilus thioautotrophic gill symbiont]CAB5506331.1 FIG071646: Sugar transferase [Bathymodiolus thermophilus thioautotrophic gill symbiont]